MKLEEALRKTKEFSQGGFPYGPKPKPFTPKEVEVLSGSWPISNKRKWGQSRLYCEECKVFMVRFPFQRLWWCSGCKLMARLKYLKIEVMQRIDEVIHN